MKLSTPSLQPHTRHTGEGRYPVRPLSKRQPYSGYRLSPVWRSARCPRPTVNWCKYGWASWV